MEEKRNARDSSANPQNNNRTFLLAIGILGGIILISVACLGGYLLLGSRSTSAAQHAAATANANNTATAAALTQEYSAISTAEASINHTSTATATVFLPTNTPTGTLSQGSIATATVGPVMTQASGQMTIVPTTTALPNPTLSTEEQFAQVEDELKRSLVGSFSYTAPTSMKVDDVFTIQLLLNQSLSPEELEVEAAQSSELSTSVAEPGVLVTGSGETVNVISDNIEITSSMKAVLVLEDPQAFEVQRLHDDDIQFIGSATTTTWQWLIRAKKEGLQNLIIVIYRLVKVNDDDKWVQVETYKASINVDVNIAERVKSWDWKWAAGTIIIPIIVGIWKFFSDKKKEADKASPPRRIK